MDSVKHRGRPDMKKTVDRFKKPAFKSGRANDDFEEFGNSS